MIPNHLAVVPVNLYQQAAIHAMVLVEQKKEQGKSVAQFPFAKAFFRVLNEGRSQVKANDIRLIASNYDPRERHKPSINCYIAALDELIESNGQHCPLPLPYDTGELLFPSYGLFCRNRRHRKGDLDIERQSRRRTREEQQKHRRYQNRLAQAEIELAFVTPTTIGSWYAYWQRQDIYIEDLSESVMAWCERFPCLVERSLDDLQGNALWRILYEIQFIRDELTDAERSFNDWLIPNKLRDNRGRTVHVS
ncbi:plasmid SOS inhibition protein A [Acerihabitans sp. TG2]|uniref:plasmid SOS inhibition protein A n=1 Tax=Acerihabitans sp. TG2 TaxID=3096008 RepID=UPI002B223645|nr:plasmid SOS inhibition protein A [Acerihabitans sp. TG2]MEA9392674.1 plasmid SOS inhibition protein A [Acerihabitans sp. TG2]